MSDDFTTAIPRLNNRGPSALKLMFTNVSTGAGVHEPWGGNGGYLEPVPMIKPDGEWVTYPIPDSLPDNTIGIAVQGILRMSNTDEHYPVHHLMSFRSSGRTEDYKAVFQQRAGERISEALGKANDGDRTPGYVPVPVKDRKFEVKWEYKANVNAKEWVDGAFGVNLNVPLYYIPFADAFAQEMFKYSQGAQG